MLETSKFTDAVKKYYTSNEKVIDFYLELLYEAKNNNLLDGNFISQMSDHDKTLHRLSELLMFKYCLASSITEISSENIGPDIIIQLDDIKINIEIITPIKVSQKRSSMRVFNCTPYPSSEPSNYSVPQDIPDMNSLHPRITNALTKKSDKYREYLTDGIVSSDDVNIVCINIGFIENVDLVDFPYLKNLFYKQEVICIDIDNDSNVSHSIEDNDFNVIKENNTIYKTSYLDNEIYPHIDAVWLICCNDKNLDYLKKLKYNEFEMYKNIIYRNNETKVPESLLSALCINKPPRNSFNDYIRENGKLPN